MALPALPNYYDALGVPQDASPATIKAKYYQLARLYHPNRHGGNDETKRGLAAHFNHIHIAWETLSCPTRRRRYHQLLELAEAENQARRGIVDLDDNDGRQSMDETSPMSPIDGKAWTENSWSNPAEHRRELERLKMRELKSFYHYRDAVFAKLQAEEEAERLYEVYDTAKWRREYFQNMPKEPSVRVKTVSHLRKVIKALQPPRAKRPHRSTTVTYPPQLVTSGHGFAEGSFLSPDSIPSIGSRLGYSSDVTGDQTSSDDDSAHYHVRRRHSRSLLPVPSAKNRRRPAAKTKPLPDPPTPDHSGSDTGAAPRPPRMLLKRPTGFEGKSVVEVEESSQESASASSASRSGPSDTNRVCKDLMVVSRYQLRHHKHRAPAASSRGSHGMHDASSDGSDIESMAADISTAVFEKKQLGLAILSTIPNEFVLDLNTQEKDRLLLAEDYSEAQSQQLLNRFAALDKSAAEKFLVKPEIKTGFHFRLLFSDAAAVKARHESFIALSYRRKLLVQRNPGHFTLPLASDMFQAVLEERTGANEGIWIDQICIDQDSDDEKTLSMSAMDMVYRSARLIVVALDDIELTAKESVLLDTHMHEYTAMAHVAPTKRFRRRQPPYLETHEDLSQVVQKLLSSSWFRRAWCRHEMRLARDHIFLLHCQTHRGMKSGSVLRFTGECMAHLIALATEVPSEESSEALKPALHAFFRDRTRPRAYNAAGRLQHGNFTTVVSEVFAMDAGGDPRLPQEQRDADARKDKLQIVLNTMEAGLTLSPKLKARHIMASQSDCFYMLTLLALAAGDPGAMCTVGQPMQAIEASTLLPRARTTWLFEPTNIDSGLNNFRTLVPLPKSEVLITSRISTAPDWTEHFVELDLKLLNSEYHRRTASGISATLPARRPRRSTFTRSGDLPELIHLAEDFVSTCERRKFGRQRRRYLVNDPHYNEIFGSMRDIYVRTLACIFHFGPDWVTEICRRYHVSRWRQDLESAKWLLITLRNTDGRWPDETNQRAPWLKDAASFLMDFVNFLIIRGMPLRQVTRTEVWRPICVQTLSNGKILTYAPVERGDVQPAIPCAVLDEEYNHLARLWILKRRSHTVQEGVGPSPCHWTLLGKSVLFSDTLAMSMVNDEINGPHQRARIFGRHI